MSSHYRAQAATQRTFGALLACALVLCPFGFVCARAETMGCGQQFTSLGVTAGNPPVAWVTEDIGGQCAFSFLIQIAVQWMGVEITIGTFAHAPRKVHVHPHRAGLSYWSWLHSPRIAWPRWLSRLFSTVLSSAALRPSASI